ncbi:helix-turn-helix domain-containing protein [Pseudomonas aeruginosa]
MTCVSSFELQRSGRLLTAAKRLGTTHATVARHIENIERDLGTQLFAQHTGGYQLTPAGQAPPSTPRRWRTPRCSPRKK